MNDGELKMLNMGGLKVEEMGITVVKLGVDYGTASNSRI